MQLSHGFSLPSLRRWGAGLGIGLLAVALVLTGCDSDDSGMDDEFDDPATTLTLAQRVSNQDALSTLNTALGVTGQAETLGDEDASFTVFAPSNAAFEPYDVDFLTNNTGLLSSVIDYHIVQGQALTADNLEDGQTVTTVQGDELEVTIDDDGSVFVEGAQVTTADVEATNGVAHVVDDVLLTNRTATERVQVANATDTLNTALGATGQAETLGSNNETFTVFAPSDAAFESYDVDLLTNNTELLSSVLDYHIVQGDAVTSSDLSAGENTFQTVQGDEITVTVGDDGTVSVEGAQVTAADIEAGNAAIHLIDDVLLTNRTLAERLQTTTATQELYNAVTSAGLGGAFNNQDNTWTTFAPNNEAFENADLSGFSDSEIQEILQYHVLPDQVTDSGTLLDLLSQNDGQVSVGTLQGEEVTITQQDSTTIVFNGGEATLNLNRVDQRAGNGIIHQIDGLLIPPSITRSVSYDLAAQSNDGAFPEGVNGTVTFWEVDANRTAVTLELENGATGADVAHPAHIHDGESGEISIYLTPIDGSDGGNGTSARIVNQPFDSLATFDGYVNIHESVENLGTVVAQGDVGANAEGTLAAGLDLVDDPRSTTYALDANSNEGSVAPNGLPGSVTFLELTSGMTFVQVSLNTNGEPTGADVSHPAHIHRSSDNGIEYFLSPVDGTDAESRSGKLVGESYDTLTSFDGYVNVHQSVSNLKAIVSQGNVGAAAN